MLVTLNSYQSLGKLNIGKASTSLILTFEAKNAFGRCPYICIIGKQCYLDVGFYYIIYTVLYSVICRPSDHTVGRLRAENRTRAGRPRGTLPLDHYTSLLFIYLFIIYYLFICYLDVALIFKAKIGCLTYF